MLIVQNESILSFCMSLAAPVFVLLFDNTVMLLLTPSIHFQAHILFGHAYLHKLIHLHAGLVCGVGELNRIRSWN